MRLVSPILCRFIIPILLWLVPSGKTACDPCADNQSTMIYDKNFLDSNQSINDEPASRCDNCDQNTISKVINFYIFGPI
ncbi:unnamed protein product [Meloidogyne enterolobii]|uniref:Uncharacterized protein n=1 Tax=Meloidogyne enterolobii TaxID=390850 RepID=A0ACB0XTI7_MELEN